MDEARPQQTTDQSPAVSRQTQTEESRDHATQTPRAYAGDDEQKGSNETCQAPGSEEIQDNNQNHPCARNRRDVQFLYLQGQMLFPGF